MEKLKIILENCIDGKFPRGITRADFLTMVEIFRDLVKNNRAEFLQSSIVPVLKRCKISVEPDGIGYIAKV